MTLETALPAGLMIGVALLLVAAATADLEPDKRLWATTERRANLGLALLACALTFCAGAVL